ncbi:Gamete expressed, partial [Thalictrum thalictroides]
MILSCAFAAQEPLRKTTYKLTKPLVGDDGKIYTCSERNLFAFESNGTIAWTIHLNYSCHVDVAPVSDGRGKIFFIAENRILKISPTNNGNSESTVEISNNWGELYSLSIRSPQFNWIQDVSAYDEHLIITPGNNGHLYVTVPVKALVFSLDVYTGNVLWQNDIGPLSTTDCSPVVDSN